MHLILTGATGLLGSGVLDAMLRNQQVTKISILSRRPVQMAQDWKASHDNDDDDNDSRVQVIIPQTNNFGQWHRDPQILDQLRGADGCVWALGISQTQASSPEEYVDITKTMTLDSAEAFVSKLRRRRRSRGEGEGETRSSDDDDDDSSNTSSSSSSSKKNKPFRFVYVTAGDTTTQPGRFTPLYARVKGETELALDSLQTKYPPGSPGPGPPGSTLLLASSVRPWLIDDSDHEAIRPYVPVRPLAHRLFLPALSPIVRLGYKSWWSPTKPLGELLVEIAMGKHDDARKNGGEEEVEVLENGFTVYKNGYLRRVKGF